MTESLLLVICEGGTLPYQALARSGSCNRSLYAVCEKLLAPAVQNYRRRLSLAIAKEREERLWCNEFEDRHALWNEDYSAPWVVQRLLLGHGFCEHQIREATFAKDEWVLSLQVWGGLGPCELRTYSPETLRQWRQLTAKQLRCRDRYTHGYTYEWLGRAPPAACGR